jgi:peptidoglycan/LPS O-acetylase OafA/YrhL
MPEHSVHLWSLAVEEQFYLLWPLVVVFLDRTRLLRVAIGAMAVALLFRLVMQTVPGGNIAGYALLPARMDALALGGTLALAVRGEHGLAVAPRLARRLLGAAAVLLAIAIGWNALSVSAADGWLPALARPTQLAGYVGTELASGALLLIALSARLPFLNRALTSSTLVALGKYSYGLYLIHIPIRDLVRVWLGPRAGLPPIAGGSQLPAQIALYLGGIGVSVVLALASWHLYEKHFLKLKVLFPYGRAARSKPAPERFAQTQAAPEVES